MGHSNVVGYLRAPVVFALETAFLLIVGTHSLLELRAILLELGPDKHVDAMIDLALVLAGLCIVVYGVKLSLAIASWGV